MDRERSRRDRHRAKLALPETGGTEGVNPFSVLVFRGARGMCEGGHVDSGGSSWECTCQALEAAEVWSFG